MTTVVEVESEVPVASKFDRGRLAYQVENLIREGSSAAAKSVFRRYCAAARPCQQRHRVRLMRERLMAETTCEAERQQLELALADIVGNL